MTSTTFVPTYQADLFVAPSVDVTANLSHTLSVEWLLRSLHAADDKFNAISEHSKVRNVTAVDITQGKGYASTIYKVSISFENDEFPYEVLLKVPRIDSVNNNPASTTGGELLSNDLATSVHNRECEFYNNLASEIDIPLVKVFRAVRAHNTPGAVLMKSLVGKAESFPMAIGAPIQQAYALAEHLASLYKFSMCMPEERWRGKYTDNALSAALKDEGKFLPFFEKLAQMKPEVFDEGIRVFRKFACSESFHSYVLTEVYKDCGLPAVLVHGDTWANNLLWKKSADGSLSNELAAIIDWQVSHEGCMTTDIARFMTLCLDGDVRRQHEFEVLQYLYRKIVDLMGADGKTVTFTFDQMKRAYKVNLVGQTVQLMVMVGFVHGDGKYPPEHQMRRLAEREKLLLRTQFAVEDALEYFQEIPKDRL